MRDLINIFEHNSGDLVSMDPTYVESKIADSTHIHSFILTFDNSGGSIEDLYRYSFEGDNDRLYFTIDKKSSAASSYLLVSKLNNFWQVKDVCVYEKFQRAGLATELCHHVIRTELGSLISDSQMSTQAEALFSAFERLLKVRIYDKKLNKIYDKSSIGQKTSDGSTILTPEEDIVDPLEDYNLSQIRFFYIVESDAAKNEKLLESLSSNKRLQHYLKFKSFVHDPAPSSPIIPRFSRKNDP